LLKQLDEGLATGGLKQETPLDYLQKLRALRRQRQGSADSDDEATNDEEKSEEPKPSVSAVKSTGKTTEDDEDDWTASEEEDDDRKATGPAPPPPGPAAPPKQPPPPRRQQYDDDDEEEEGEDDEEQVQDTEGKVETSFSPTSSHSFLCLSSLGVDDLTGEALVRPPSLHNSFRRASQSGKRLPSRKKGPAPASDLFAGPSTEPAPPVASSVKATAVVATAIADDDIFVEPSVKPASPTKTKGPPPKPKPKPKPKPVLA